MWVMVKAEKSYDRPRCRRVLPSDRSASLTAPVDPGGGMSCRVSSFVAVLVGTLTATSALAQTRPTDPQRVRQQAAAGLASGQIRGVVHDQAGTGLGGVTIVAMGAALASARSDPAGRFSLALLPGEYILRATRDGYVSTYREAV